MNTALRITKWLTETENFEPGVLISCLVEGMKSLYRLDGDTHLYKKSDILVYEHRIYDGSDDVQDVCVVLEDAATQGVLLRLLWVKCPWTPIDKDHLSRLPSLLVTAYNIPEYE